jgi:hypothetical protein
MMVEIVNAVVQRWKSQRIKIFDRFLNPYPRVWFSFWKSQTFGKSLKPLVRGFFLEIFEIHRLVWMFVLYVFHQFFLKGSTVLILLLLNFTNADLSRRPSAAFLYHRMVSFAPKKSIGQAL